MSAEAEPTSQPRSRIRALDGLRAFAVLLVMLLHYRLAACGWIGVPIFFVLSGFLITQILLDDRDRPLGEFLKRFWFRRALRIFPLAYAYLAALAALAFSGLFAALAQPLAEAAPYLATYTYNFTRLSPTLHDRLFMHFWSLCVEEQFYLLWPLAVHAFGRRGLKRLLAILIISAPLFRWAYGAHLLDAGIAPALVGDSVYWSFGSHVDAFAMGAAIAVLDLPQRIASPGRWLAVATVMLALAMGTVVVVDGSDATRAALGFPVTSLDLGQHVWRYTLIDLWTGSVIVFLIRGGRGTRIFACRPVSRFGEVSYGVYVLHLLVLVFFLHKAPFELGTSAAMLAFPLYFGIVWLVAEASHRFFEQPILRLRGRLAE